MLYLILELGDNEKVLKVTIKYWLPKMYML